jgi:hypothetical protein
MNLVSVALRRPISLLTIVVAAALMGFLALDRMSQDIFPDLGVPVLYVAQPYGGMDPAQMEGFIVNYYEYHFLYITGIEHVESKSIQGVGLIKLQFHPGTNMTQATAETVAYVDRARAFMPTGAVPPFVMRFDGGSVPVGDLVFSSKTKTVAELQDALPEPGPENRAVISIRSARPPIITVMSGLAAPDRQRHWLSALAAEVIAARASGPKWFHQRQAGGARDSNSDLWSYLENLSSADCALEEKVIELAASYAASVTGADDNPKIIGYGRIGGHSTISTSWKRLTRWPRNAARPWLVRIHSE